MRNYILPVIGLVLFTGLGCLKPQLKNVPDCIEKKIARLRSQGDAPLSVSEYLYNGKKVYLFSMDCCDRYNELYDADCQYICSPSGGFSGGGDGKCVNFNQEAEFLRELWKKK